MTQGMTVDGNTELMVNAVYCISLSLKPFQIQWKIRNPLDFILIFHSSRVPYFGL